MSAIRKLPPFEQSFAAILLGAKEAVVAPMRPKLREYNITEPQWRVMRVINDRGRPMRRGLLKSAYFMRPA